MQSYNSTFGTPSTLGGVFGGTSTGVFRANTSPMQSNSNFGAPSGFGQNQNPNNNQFTQQWGSTFSGTSTGIFGTSSSPLPSNGSSVFSQPNSVIGTSSFTPSTMSPFSSGFGFNSNASYVASTTSPSSSSGLVFSSPSSSSNWFGLTSSPSTGFNFNSSPNLSSTGFALNSSPSTGLSFGFYPSFSSTGFGINSSPNTGFGINSSSSAGFSFSSSPSFSSTGFGLNSSSISGFGLNSSPTTGFGINSSPNTGFSFSSSPSFSSTGFGLNSSPSTGFGFNSSPSTGFGFNSSPSTGFGLNSSPSTGFGFNSSPSTGFGFNSSPSTGFGFNSSPSSGFGFNSSPSTRFGFNSSPSTGFGFSFSPSTGFGFSSSPSTGFSSSTSTWFGINSSPSTGFGFNSSPGLSFKPQTYTSNSAPSMLSTPSTGFPSNSPGFFQPTSSFPGSSTGCQISTPPYSKTVVTDGAERRLVISISAMPVYNDQNSKSHEELRWESKGGSQIGPTSTTSGHPKPFTSFTPTNNIFNNHQNTSSWLSSPQPNNIFNNNQNTSSWPFSPQPNNNIFNNQNTSSWLPSRQPNSLSTPVNTSSLFPQTTSHFITATSPATPSSVSGPSNTFPSPYNLDGYKVTTSPAVQPAVFNPWLTQQITTLPASTTTVTTVSQTQTTLPGVTGFVGLNKPAQVSVEPIVTHLPHPFESEPARQPLYISAGPTQSLYHGISSIPVHYKQEMPVRRSISLLTARSLSQRRRRLPLHKHNTKVDTPKVPFFIDDCQVTPLFPRENLKDFITAKGNPKESSSHPTHKAAVSEGLKKAAEVTLS